jgi:predicted RNase H-like nuclease
LAGSHVDQVVVVERFAQLAEEFASMPTAVDIPIGLVDCRSREADMAARVELSGSASSVFSAPCRAVVDGFRAGDIRDYMAANACARQATGAGLSRQAWNIVPKIAEIDEQIERGADLYEVHPELSFRLLARRRLASKRTWNGAMARLVLLREVGIVPPQSIDGGDRVRPDDVFDAAVAAWTAAGAHRPEGLRSHPLHPTQFDRGRPIAIWTRRDV